MTQKKHIPIRTCIGCRKKRKKGEMIWFAHGPEGVIRVDVRKPHAGRGFYLCPDLRCLKMAKGRKKAVEFPATMNFPSLLVKGFSQNDKVCDRGGRE
jgi:uncharacterized protein